jgi:hypothetical protein
VVIRLLAALSMMALCVVIHAGGVAWALRALKARAARAPRSWTDTWVFVLIAAWMVVLHLVEVSSWAAFYVWRGAIPDLESAMYFSAVTYTTTGYGDIVLPADWRLVGGIEALTGILMCGFSTGFFFAVVSRVYESRSEGA